LDPWGTLVFGLICLFRGSILWSVGFYGECSDFKVSTSQPGSEHVQPYQHFSHPGIALENRHHPDVSGDLPSWI
jgi:hypothetical protein